MAKRNLARTAIEGGRSPHNRMEEFYATRAERQQFKKVLNQVKNNPDEADEIVVKSRTNNFWGREFDDKLNPVYRWLTAQSGRLWDDVYSEVKAKFPARSLAGRHIVGHIEGFVSKESHVHNRYTNYGLVVGLDGVLRDFGRRKKYRYRSNENPNAQLIASVNWLLEYGWHSELNSFMKKNHIRVFVKNKPYPSRETYTVTANFEPRLLEGKHDVEKFVEDVVRASRYERQHGNAEWHTEWKGNLESFIKNINPRLLKAD